MGFGLRIFVFGELFDADQRLRRQARSVSEAADDLNVSVGGLPPEAESVVAGLRGLRGQLDRAAHTLVAAAGTIGRVGAGAARADAGNWPSLMWEALQRNVLPPDDPGPFGELPWWLGRVAFGTGAGVQLARARAGHRPWVKHGSKYPLYGSRYVAPARRSLIDRAARLGKVGGAGGVFAGSLSRRLNEGAGAPRAAGGAVGESATVLGCATTGAKIGLRAPIPHPAGKAAAAVGGGVAGGVACSGPGRWVGDRASDAVDEIGEGAGKVVDGAGTVVDAGKSVIGIG